MIAVVGNLAPPPTSRIKTWLTLNILLLAIVAALSLTYPVEELSRRLGDIYFRVRSPLPTSKSVVLVLIDDQSLGKYGRWPWPRALLARLVRATAAQRPAVIGLDVLLPESEDVHNDQDLASAFREAGNVVLASKITGSPQHLWTDPLPLFVTNSVGLGHVQAVQDPDGICRKIPVREMSIDGPRLALSVEVARLAKERIAGRNLHLPSRQAVPSVSAARWESFHPEFLTVNFREQYSADQRTPPFLVISAADLLAGKQVPALAGKATLIGFGATELSDRLTTPVSAQMPMPGVEIHANVIDGLMRGDTLQHVKLFPQICFIAVFSLLSTWLILRQPGWSGVILQSGFLLVAYGASYLLFVFANRLVAFGPVLVAGLLSVPLAQLQNLITVNRGLSRGLRHLQETVRSTRSTEELASFSSRPASHESVSDLQWRINLVNDLQLELASLYTFRQHLLESMHEGVAAFTANGKILFRNAFWEVFCRKQGWDPDINLIEFGRLLEHPSWANIQQDIKRKTLALESEVYLGGGFWQIRGTPIAPNKTGDPSQWMVVVTDLTARLERDQARAEALRFVTHELRTPLVSIQGFSEFLLRYPQAASSKEAAATIFRESQRLVSLINTYLDVLRFDAGARSLRREPVVIPLMIAQAERVMSPIAEAATVRIIVHVDSDMPVLECDGPILSGVILNLLNNAVKYSPPGSEVNLRVTSVRGQVIFEISNPGPAIPPDDLPHLFEPFYRARGTSDSAPGWGLGLTFVKRAVEEHNGTIEASSDHDVIRVTVTLPVPESQKQVSSNSHPELGPRDPPSGSV
jgi:signal transduction histidine kinase